MPVRIVRLGSPRAPGEGTRIGTVRRPPRGDRAEMATPENRHSIALLAALSQQSYFSVGCYCEDEAHCHRSVLRALLADAGARIVD
jgi:uncharacterized protein YeaO (DUF488 family)